MLSRISWIKVNLDLETDLEMSGFFFFFIFFLGFSMRGDGGVGFDLHVDVRRVVTVMLSTWFEILLGLDLGLNV